MENEPLLELILWLRERGLRATVPKRGAPYIERNRNAKLYPKGNKETAPSGE